MRHLRASRPRQGRGHDHQDLSRAESQFAQLEALGIDMNAVGETLKQDGLIQFEQAFSTLLETTA